MTAFEWTFGVILTLVELGLAFLVIRWIWRTFLRAIAQISDAWHGRGC
jgi:hypothetical protein